MTPDERERRRAVAVSGLQAPRGAQVVARGYGELAEQIIALARAHDLPVHAAPELVGLLLQLDLDERIPDDLYAVLAAVVSWAGALDARVAEAATP